MKEGSMGRMPAWQYDEFRHVGVDYADTAVAEEYDARHARFRGDMAGECDRLLDELGVGAGTRLLDVGCGTGILALQAAKRGAAVWAADTSEAMLGVARARAEAAGVHGISFCRGGFLTYEHVGPPLDVITTSAALHHLPDFWKLVGVRRLAGMLRQGGIFYLMDTVYSFPVEEHARFFDGKVEWFRRQAGEEFAAEVETAVREEFTTLDWVMEGILTRAGLIIERAHTPDGMLARYFCRRDPAEGVSPL